MPPDHTAPSPRPTQRGPWRPRVVLWLAATLASAAWGQSVQCHVNYGGEDSLITAAPTQRPLETPATEIGSYFLFRVVNTLGSAQPSVKVYTYASQASGPVPIHQATHTAAQVHVPGTPVHGFTGLQRVYEPVRDGELTYWCERAHPLPPRSRRAVATGTADAHSQALPAAASPVLPLGTPGTLRLLFAGDVMLADGPGKVIADGRDPLAPFAALLREADYTIGNLELPIATVGQPLDNKIYSFRAPPDVLPVLQGRFNALALANNHSGDYGQDAFLQTMQHLDAAGIAHFGGGRNLSEAHRPLWVERQGLRVAVLAYNEFKPRSFAAGPNWPGVAWSEDDRVVADIRAARAAGADLVIPFMHWGWERERQPTRRQRELARLMIDAGADVVVGGHPHVTQGVDLYRGKLIVYSLGNFVFDGFEDVPGGQTGWLLRLTLGKHGLVAWDTLAAQMDHEGTPHPSPGVATPCGRMRPVPQITHCVNP
ncbi:MAG: hypothetical protein C0445_11475 [Polaromonas sp.]|nr:hypothetical protein [Polaromonas sp.]